MWLVPTNFLADDWTGPISVMLLMTGVAAISCVFAPIYRDRAPRVDQAFADGRHHRAVLMVKLAILIFGILCLVIGTLMQFFWVKPVGP